MPLHPTEYLIEAALLGAFMVTACLVVAFINHPASPCRRRLGSGAARRLLVAVCMGITATLLIHSPWGRQSGAHMNPATTIAFLVLDRIRPADAVFYIGAQFSGGALGVGLMRLLLPTVMAHPDINFVVTAPGRRGPRAAWLAEFIASLVLMLFVLASSSSPALESLTGYGAGVLVALAIFLIGPISGMSLNPARTFASMLFANTSWRHSWIYATAPILGMLVAVALFGSVSPLQVPCAKLRHDDRPCIFNCHRAPAPHAR